MFPRAARCKTAFSESEHFSWTIILPLLYQYDFCLFSRKVCTCTKCAVLFVCQEALHLHEICRIVY